MSLIKSQKSIIIYYKKKWSYDLMNDLMSFGIHRCWKKTFIDDIGVLKSRNIGGKESN